MLVGLGSRGAIVPAAWLICVDQMLYFGGAAKHQGHFKALLLLPKAALLLLLLAGQAL